jgi:hypothetical protein
MNTSMEESSNILMRMLWAWKGYVRTAEPWYVKIPYHVGRNMPRLVRRRTLSLLRATIKEFEDRQAFREEYNKTHPENRI